MKPKLSKGTIFRVRANGQVYQINSHYTGERWGVEYGSAGGLMNKNLYCDYQYDELQGLRVKSATDLLECDIITDELEIALLKFQTSKSELF